MSKNAWPRLPPLSEWRPTHDTLHRWMQIVGKVRLALTPWTNHSWHVPLYVTAHGLTTSVIYARNRPFEIQFDFLEHRLRVDTADGELRFFSLEAMSTASFYRLLMQALEDLQISVEIWPIPVEIPGPVEPFDEDEEHAVYDPAPVTDLWLAYLQTHRVFTEFRAHFLGKVSPVHLFWGAMDMAVTRFSGRTAPKHPGGAPHCAEWIIQEAYSHELSSAGFWPGAGLGEAAFYSYAYPEPPGFAGQAIQPREAYYHEELGEYLLPYEAVRSAEEPDAALFQFLQNTYELAADLGGWDRDALERAQLPPEGFESPGEAAAQ